MDHKKKPHTPKSLFSQELEEQARQQVKKDLWRHHGIMMLFYYLIDIGGALVRALLHVVLWVPAIVVWPLLLSSNGLVLPEWVNWIIQVGGGGWEGAIWKLIGAVFILSVVLQLLRGSMGERFRRHLDKHMERSLVWQMLETQLPLAPRDDDEKQPVIVAPEEQNQDKTEQKFEK